jgi:HSP20 family protein
MIVNLVKWNPFTELEDVSRRLNSIFGRTPARTESAQDMLALADWTPSVDISETDTAYLIKAEIPEVKKQDVKVTLQDGMLTIQGERRQEQEEKNKKYHRIERSYGSFARSFRVPDDADADTVAAQFKDGMLNVTLPKTGKTESKSIKVNIE